MRSELVCLCITAVEGGNGRREGGGYTGTVWWLLLYEKEEDNKKRRCGRVGSGWRIVIIQIATIRASWFDNSSVHCFFE